MARRGTTTGALQLGAHMRRNLFTAIIRYLIRLKVALFILFALPVLVFAYDKQTTDNTNVVRYTQLLLSLNGFYTGPLDGQCKTQTRQAIGTYNAALPNTLPGVGCTSQFLEQLKDKLTASLSTDNSKPHDLSSQNTAGDHNMESLSATISNIKADLANTTSTVKGINQSLSTHFVTLAYNMATVGITAFVAAISVLIAIAVGAANIFLKDRVEELHKEMLSEMHELSHAELSAKIYAVFAAHSINLYKDIPRPLLPPGNTLYNSYLSIAVELAKYGYHNSAAPQESLKNKNAKPSKEQEEVIIIVP